MKKYFVLILSLVLITACKNTTTDSTNSTDTNTTPKPTTLADRAGIYSGTNKTVTVTLTIENNGKGSFISTGVALTDTDVTFGDPTSTSTNFSFKADNKDFTINFINNNTIKLETPSTWDNKQYTLIKK